jgi:large subunit ribosomal protein L5
MAKKQEKPAKGDKAPKSKDGASKKKDGASKKKGGKAEQPAEPQGPPPTPRLQERYEKEILSALAKSLGRKNRLSLPKVVKIVINMGVGSAINEKKHMEEAVDALKLIAGQKPIITKARKSVAGFRLREEMPIGCKVTLRSRRMYEFLDRLISMALPRVRDFRGLSPQAFDGHGNYSLGLSEQLVFPELNPDKYSRSQGMNITIVTTTDSDDEARELLRGFGLPMRAA